MRCGTPARLQDWRIGLTFAAMYISKAKKYRQQEDGTIVAYDNYRLTKKYRDSHGNPRSCSVLCLGTLLSDLGRSEEELAVIYSLLDVKANPIGKVKSVVHPNPPPKKIHLLKTKELHEI